MFSERNNEKGVDIFVSEQTKRIVADGVMGLAVTLLLLGFIIGFVDKGKEKKSEDDNSRNTVQ